MFQTGALVVNHLVATRNILAEAVYAGPGLTERPVLAPDLGRTGRAGLFACVSILLHGAALAALVFYGAGAMTLPGEDAATAITVELSAISEPQTAAEPPPEEKSAPVAPETQPAPAQQMALAPPEPADVVLPAPPEKVVETPKPEPVKPEPPKAESPKPKVKPAPRRAESAPARVASGDAPIAQRSTTIGDAYTGAVRSRLLSRLVYPSAARASMDQGRPVVRFVIARSGAVSAVALASSSGSSVLDTAALSLAREAGPYAPLPPDFAPSTLTITIPVNYRRPG